MTAVAQGHPLLRSCMYHQHCNSWFIVRSKTAEIPPHSKLPWSYCSLESRLWGGKNVFPLRHSPPGNNHTSSWVTSRKTPTLEIHEKLMKPTWQPSKATNPCSSPEAEASPWSQLVGLCPITQVMTIELTRSSANDWQGYVNTCTSLPVKSPDSSLCSALHRKTQNLHDTGSMEKKSSSFHWKLQVEISTTSLHYL